MTADLILCAVAVAAACSLCGFFLVVRRQAMLVDAISHSILPGLVLGFALAGGPNPLAAIGGAVLAALVTGMLVERLTRSGGMSEDSALGLVFPTLFALGVLLVSLFFRQVHLDADAILLGEIVMAPRERLNLGGWDLGPQAVWWSIAILTATGLATAAAGPRTLFVGFDPRSAQAGGVPPRQVDILLLSLAAMAAVVSFRAVGAILTVALMTLPTITALLWTRRAVAAAAVAGGVAVIGALAGVGAALRLDLSISGMMTLMLGGLLLGSLILAPRRGLAAGSGRSRREARRFLAQMLVVHLHTHAGTPSEPEESRFSHLVQDLEWSRSRALTAIREAVKRGWVAERGSVLELSAEGRAEAVRLERLRSPVPGQAPKPTAISE
ncbi:MAG: metal ABC transporter permease [Fimbriimonadaceae bacterium]|nr:metal ABC transporter permease [Fimbriimonadaceae bacterium]